MTLWLDNHCYQFNGKIRVQKKGGPIGLRLTGEIADCIMIDWDKTLLAELRKLGINPDIYTRWKLFKVWLMVLMIIQFSLVDKWRVAVLLIHGLKVQIPVG